jgi:hypothetical protein
VPVDVTPALGLTLSQWERQREKLLLCRLPKVTFTSNPPKSPMPQRRQPFPLTELKLPEPSSTSPNWADSALVVGETLRHKLGGHARAGSAAVTLIASPWTHCQGLAYDVREALTMARIRLFGNPALQEVPSIIQVTAHTGHSCTRRTQFVPHHSYSPLLVLSQFCGKHRTYREYGLPGDGNHSWVSSFVYAKYSGAKRNKCKRRICCSEARGEADEISPHIPRWSHTRRRV